VVAADRGSRPGTKTVSHFQDWDANRFLSILDEWFNDLTEHFNRSLTLSRYTTAEVTELKRETADIKRGLKSIDDGLLETAGTTIHSLILAKRHFFERLLRAYDTCKKRCDAEQMSDLSLLVADTRQTYAIKVNNLSHEIAMDNQAATLAALKAEIRAELAADFKASKSGGADDSGTRDAKAKKKSGDTGKKPRAYPPCFACGSTTHPFASHEALGHDCGAFKPAPKCQVCDGSGHFPSHCPQLTEEQRRGKKAKADVVHNDYLTSNGAGPGKDSAKAAALVAAIPKSRN
jgi:hypothetical protein